MIKKTLCALFISTIFVFTLFGCQQNQTTNSNASTSIESSTSAEKTNDYPTIDLANIIQQINNGQPCSLEKYIVDGKLSDERKRVHDSIIDEFLKDKVPSGNKPEFLMIGGGAAAGKTVMINSILEDSLSNALLVDSDIIREKIPGYVEMLKNDVNATNYYYLESSALNKVMMEVARQKHLDIIYSSFGAAGLESTKKLIDKAKDKGYNAAAKYITISIEEALKRNQQRYQQSLEKNEPARLVPDESVRRSYVESSDTALETAPYFDSIEIYDNTQKKYVLIGTGGNGKYLSPIPGQEALFESFLAQSSRGIEGLERLEDGSYKPKL